MKTKLKSKHLSAFLFKKIIPFSAAFFLFASAALPVQAGHYDASDEVHGNTHYSDMAYTGFDKTLLTNTLDEMEALCEAPGNEEKLAADYQTMIDEFDRLVTQRSLNNLRYYNDVNNEEYQKVDTEMSEVSTDLADRACHTLHVVLNSSYYDSFAAVIDDPEDVEYYLNYKDLTPEQKDLIAAENDLVQKYDQASAAVYTYTDSKGKIWSSDEDDDALYQDSNTYIEVTTGLAKARNDAMAPIFMSLVENRNRQAVLQDYANYAELAYDDIYSRDYTTEEIKSVYEFVKQDFVPILPSLYQAVIDYMDPDLYEMPEVSEEELVEAVGKNIEKIDPELMIAYDYLKDYHLYDVGASDKKMDVGYTDYLYEYHAPIIFNCPDGSYYDYSVMIHEYGHYNNAYHNSHDSFTDAINMDVAEIHSQGMELLYMEYYDKLFKDKEDCVRLLTIYNIACSVVDGCLYDEFQNEVYAAETPMTLDEINELFSTLSMEYGYSETTAAERKYSWVDVSHTFQSPFYYISYATSALSALDIFSTALHDRQKAIDNYIELTTYGLDTPYCELIKTVGMRDIFTEGTIKTIANDTMKYCRSVTKHAETQKSYRFLRNVFMVLTAIIVVITLITLLILHLLKKKAEKNTPPTDDPSAGDGFMIS